MIIILTIINNMMLNFTALSLSSSLTAAKTSLLTAVTTMMCRRTTSIKAVGF
jgi:hypothetical protein